VTAALMSKEELAIALELAIFIPNLVIVIVAMESKDKLVEPEALRLLGVALGLLNFADHSIIHRSAPFTL
jgi:hypothetical protein